MCENLCAVQPFVEFSDGLVAAGGCALGDIGVHPQLVGIDRGPQLGVLLGDAVVPAHNGEGLATIALRMPEVTITDSEGRHIVISPEQADLVGSRIGDIVYWMEDSTED